MIFFVGLAPARDQAPGVGGEDHGGVVLGERRLEKGRLLYVQLPPNLLHRHEMLLRIAAGLEILVGRRDLASSVAERVRFLEAELMNGRWPIHHQQLDYSGSGYRSDDARRELPPLWFERMPSDSRRTLWIRGFEGAAVSRSIRVRVDGKTLPPTHTVGEARAFSWWLVGVLPEGARKIEILDDPSSFEMVDCLLLAGEDFHPVLWSDQQRALQTWGTEEHRFLDDACSHLPTPRPLPPDRESWRQRAQQDRAALQRALGWEPPLEAAPLQARVHGESRREDHRIQRVSFQSLPGLRVPANLYLPLEKATPCPAVLIPVGHWSVGKADEALQAQAVSLARAGIAALVPETLGQGERTHPQNSHRLAFGLALSGLSARGIMLHELRRGLDYLTEREDIDGSKLGCCGSSAGGMDSWLLAAVDERIQATAPVAFVTGFRELLVHQARQCPCVYLPGVGGSLDESDIIALAAPTPYLLVAATRDPLFPIAGTRRMWNEARPVYELLGADDRYHWFESNDGHKHNQEMRERITGFFRRWLLNEGDGSPVPELKVPRLAADDAALVVFEAGARPATRTLQDLALERAESWRKEREKAPPADRDAARRRILAGLGMDDVERRPGSFEIVETGESVPQGARLERFLSGQQPPLPLHRLELEGSCRGTILVLSSGPRSLVALSGIGRLCNQSGFDAILVDLPGAGELAHADSLAARNGILVGRSRLGQQLSHVLALLGSLPEGEPLFVMGLDATGSVLAELAAVCEPAVRGLLLHQPIESFESLIHQRFAAEVLFPARVLEHFDLPEVRAHQGSLPVIRKRPPRVAIRNLSAALDANAVKRSTDPASPRRRVLLRRVAPQDRTYTGVVLEVILPSGKSFLLWPEEAWAWVTPEGKQRISFSRAEHIVDFRQDLETGTVRYEFRGGPEKCRVQVEVTPDEDSVTIVHQVLNESEHGIRGGTPCLQDRRPGVRNTWTYAQAKRVFLWTERDGFTWSSDTRRADLRRGASRQAYSASYSMFKNAHASTFGRSPDRVSSPLIGYVSDSGQRLVAFVSDHANEVFLGRLDCVHSVNHLFLQPGETGTSRSKIYFLPADFEQLVARVRRDFPELTLPAADLDRQILGGEGRPVLSFEDQQDFQRLRGERVQTEPATRARLTVEGRNAVTHGCTHGQEALLARFEDNGRLLFPELFVLRPEARFFSMDLTLPVLEKRSFTIELQSQGTRIQRTFELFAGCPRRCVVDLQELHALQKARAGDQDSDSTEPAVTVVLLPQTRSSALVQIDGLTVYPSEDGP